MLFVVYSYIVANDKLIYISIIAKCEIEKGGDNNHVGKITNFDT